MTSTPTRNVSEGGIADTPLQASSLTLRVSLIAVVGILLMFAAGCSSEDPAAKFIPIPSVAEAAIVSAFDAWQQGTPVGEVPGTKPLVHITDSHRVPGQKLVSYQILGEVPGNAPRCYAVRFQYAEPEAEERERYVVVGIDPLWVFRHDDYDLLMHWEHPMEPSDPPSKTAP